MTRPSKRLLDVLLFYKFKRKSFYGIDWVFSRKYSDEHGITPYRVSCIEGEISSNWWIGSTKLNGEEGLINHLLSTSW